MNTELAPLSSNSTLRIVQPRPASPNPLEAVPPHDESAENCVLGAMLLDVRAARVAAQVLTRDDFYLPCSRIMFGILCGMLLKPGIQELDEVLFVQELQRAGKLEAVDGREFIGRLVIPDVIGQDLIV